MSGYPLLDLFWTMLWFFLWIMWLFLLFRIFADIFRSDDLGGWGKAGWLIFVIILPFVGVLVYLIVRGSTMNRRDLEQAQQREAAFQEYVRQAAGSDGGSSGSGSHVDQLATLAELKRNGALSPDEYDRAKAKLLA
ncbi:MULTISPECIES: SHOCT domain-containing protein [Streptacidiphilus]|uniref:SHOCT domain-containing protein n=1 Tax=Streptacidiphilus cavernicola TaxID=3342716 RepID=A0ABV6V025_9ACTN|nr:SHOCT domain-containing protein [Streptacidiphilus jeojiense]